MGQQTSTYPDDKVVLYQSFKGKQLPSPSPYVMKLATYLRMANIDYVNDCNGKQSSKGKVPWIRYKGQEVADSQFCIEFLNEKFNIDLNKNLTVEQKAVSRSFLKMVDENLYWGYLLYLAFETDVAKLVPEPPFLMKLLKSMFLRRVKNSAWAQGMARHTKEEVAHIVELDLAAISDYLDDKLFFMGEEPTEVDAAIFGFLAWIKFTAEPGSKHFNFMQEHPKIAGYIDRMKEKYWCDWDNCLYKPPSGTTTKPTETVQMSEQAEQNKSDDHK